MFLNSIGSAAGSVKSRRRVGRGIGSGLGKTCGRGHKGQKSRAGGFHKIGFEGGQMPLQRRLPKRGFYSVASKSSTEIKLEKLLQLNLVNIDMLVLKELGFISKNVRSVKVVSALKTDKKMIFKGIKVSKSVRIAVENASGEIEE